jgi:hypothetical protein
VRGKRVSQGYFVEKIWRGNVFQNFKKKGSL